MFFRQPTNIGIYFVTLLPIAHIGNIMRRKILLLLAAILLPILAGAQAQINTKKFKIGDFTEKTTKVVLTGNDFYDSCLKDEVAARWRISPYEFCTLDDFETLKKEDSFYFLLTTKGQFRKETEPGLQFLTLIKGGQDAEKGKACAVFCRYRRRCGGALHYRADNCCNARR